MKQNITIEQLNELSPEGKERLLEWISTNKDPSGFMLYGRYLSIGQMIEFLEEHGCHFWVTDSWVVETMHKAFVGDELADALWEAVKEVLNK